MKDTLTKEGSKTTRTRITGIAFQMAACPPEWPPKLSKLMAMLAQACRESYQDAGPDGELMVVARTQADNSECEGTHTCAPWRSDKGKACLARALRETVTNKHPQCDCGDDYKRLALIGPDGLKPGVFAYAECEQGGWVAEAPLDTTTDPEHPTFGVLTFRPATPADHFGHILFPIYA